MHLDHVTIRTRDLAKTRDFLVTVLDLEERPRPKAIERMLPGHWLYADDQPIFHLIPGGGNGRGNGRGNELGNGQNQASEAIDHVGIHLDGYSNFKQKLTNLDVPHSTMDLPELNERRVFFRTPGGPLLEAVFNESINTQTHS